MRGEQAFMQGKKSNTMRFTWASTIILIVGVTLVALWPRYADAQPSNSKVRGAVEKACRQVEKAADLMNALQKKRAKYLSWLKKLRDLAARLQKSSAGPARDYRLRAVMGEAREMAAKLSKLDRRLRRLRQQGKKLAGRLQNLSSKLGRAGRKRVSRCLARARVLVPGKNKRTGRLSKVELDPSDGPAEIRRKADLLADSADKIAKRLKKLKQSIQYLQRQVALRKAVRRTDRKDEMWGSDSRRRVAVRVDRSAKVRGVVTPKSEGDDGQTGGPQDTTDGHYENSSLAGDANPDPAAAVGGGERNSGGSSVSLQTVWKTTIQAIQDLTDPSTAAEIRKGFSSGNVKTRLAALKRAQRILRKNGARLRKKSRKFRKKARNLDARMRHKKTQ